MVAVTSPAANKNNDVAVTLADAEANREVTLAAPPAAGKNKASSWASRDSLFAPEAPSLELPEALPGAGVLFDEVYL
ncbi:MAG: hypothetical protein ABI923_03170 [bacterium]